MECVPHSDPQVREPNQLSVGTPRQLADNGALSRFIERDGIIFERDTLTLRISKL
jgi:iron complex transport system ATP-binding protein